MPQVSSKHQIWWCVHPSVPFKTVPASQLTPRKNPYSPQGPCVLFVCLRCFLTSLLHLLFPRLLNYSWTLADDVAPLWPLAVHSRWAWCFFHAQCSLSCHFNSRSLRKNPFTGNPAKHKVHLHCANLTATTKQYYIQVFRVWLPENRWEKRKLYLLLAGGSTWKCGRSL